MLFLNEIERQRLKVRQAALSASELKTYAASIASRDDVSALMSAAAGDVYSEIQLPDSSAWAAYFQGGLTGFGERALQVLRRNDALKYVIGVSSVMKDCVLECNDGSAWAFLKEAAELEKTTGDGFYTDASEDVRAINNTLGTHRLRELESGNRTPPDFLLGRYNRLRTDRERARTIWRLKQYIGDAEVYQFFKNLHGNPTWSFAATQCLIFFSQEDADLGFLDPSIQTMQQKTHNSSDNRFAPTAEVVANILAAFAIRTGSSFFLKRIKALLVPLTVRRQQFLVWCTQRIR